MVTEKEQKETPGAETGDDEVKSLKQKCEALYQEIKNRDSAVIRLESELKAKDSEIAGLKEAAEDSERTLSEREETLARTVAAYREQIIQGNPGVLADLISGESIEEIDESLKKAMALIEKVKQEMEDEAARMRIPGGAPQRTQMDLSALSPREKIQYAIGGS